MPDTQAMFEAWAKSHGLTAAAFEDALSRRAAEVAPPTPPAPAPEARTDEAMAVLRELVACGAVDNWLRVSPELKDRARTLLAAQGGEGKE